MPDPPSNESAEVPELDFALFDADRVGPADAATIEAALIATVARYGEAPVVALRDDAVGAPMPESVPVRRKTVSNIRTGLDVIAFDDEVIAAWERVLTTGLARCRIRLVRTPDATGTNYMFDLRENHGVIVVVNVMDSAGEAGAVDVVAEAPGLLYKPRFATVARDRSGVVLRVDESFTAILGWTGDELVGERLHDRIHPDDQQLSIDHWMQTLADPGVSRRVRLRHRNRDGDWVWFEVANHNALADPVEGCVVTELLDISEEMAALDGLRAREALLTQMAETMPVGLMQIDTRQRVIYNNTRLLEIAGCRRAASLREQLQAIVPHERPLLDEAVADVLRTGGQADLEVVLAPEGADERTCTISLRALLEPDGSVRGAIVCVTDVTESTQMREELRRRATFDDLTGCHNRASVMHALEQHIAVGGRLGTRAVVYADLDGFKAMNDRDGHAAGDTLLRLVAERLRSATRGGDIVGRIGGDEFLILCPRVGSQDEATVLVDRVRAAVGGEARVSIGVAWSTGNELDADALVARADAAMYAAKRDGGNAARLAA